MATPAPAVPAPFNKRYVLYVPGMPFDGNTIRHASLGGSETMGYYLARELARAGNEVVVFSGCAQACDVDGVAYEPIGERNERFPFGEAYQRKVATLPHDVTIAQRQPGIFNTPCASALRLWWTHDLALERSTEHVRAGLWNAHGVLAVSEWHKQQVAKTYGLPPDFIHVLPNGVDRSLFDPADPALRQREKVMVYSSRPERGLPYLLQPDGIMERLARTVPDATLLICTYDHAVPELAGQYAQLREWAARLPNVAFLDPRTKAGMGDLMSRVWLHVYPVVPPLDDHGHATFEEVSCIAAMEAQAGGTPCVTAPWGALPETLDGAGVYWAWQGGSDTLPKDAAEYVGAFVSAIETLADKPDLWLALHRKALKSAQAYAIGKLAERVSAIVDRSQSRAAQRPARLAHHLLYWSDKLAFDALRAAGTLGSEKDWTRWARSELPRYAESQGDPASANAHYADYNLNVLKNHHNLGNDSAILTIHRNAAMRSFVEALPAGARVLDYGCGIGPATVAFARLRPDCTFVGTDIVRLSIERAEAYRAEHAIANLSFAVCGEPRAIQGAPYDLVIASEIIEHVNDPSGLCNGLEALLAPAGRMLLTFPQGPSELQRGDEFPWHEHVSHFDHHDIRTMFGGKPGFAWHAFGWGEIGGEGNPIGGMLVTWTKGGAPVSAPDYASKPKHVVPREHVSLCAIIKWDALDLDKMLRSAEQHVDEIIIGIDDAGNPEPGSGPAWAIAADHEADNVFALSASPLVQGFDAARNETIVRARSEWILWLDADERLCYGERMRKYLRRSWLDSWAIPQHHIAVEPVGNLRTDLPCRLFRADLGMKFYGIVHEHPCYDSENPPRHAAIMQDVCIEHPGYYIESVRKARFERNWPLIQRDRIAYPKRTLGIMLFLRDCGHQTMYSRNQGDHALASRYAVLALSEWDRLLACGDIRLALEGLPYATIAAEHVAGPAAIRIRLALDTARLGMLPPRGTPEAAPQMIQGTFATPAAAEFFLAYAQREAMKAYHNRYW